MVDKKSLTSVPEESESRPNSDTESSDLSDEETPKSSGRKSKPQKKCKQLQHQAGDQGDVKKKPSAKKKGTTVCLTNCRYDVIRRITDRLGYRDVPENDTWNFYWTDLSISIERCKDMKRFQKINHFPGMLEICRKDLLARNLNRMQRLYPKDYNFFPKSWCLPADLGEALSYSRLRKNKTFILKPDAGSQGRGIFITKSLKDIKPNERMICQVYISRPFLIDGYKFDLRVYTLVTSCDPLRIYIYNEGLVRFATSRYKEPTGINVSNVFMHLTNYAVNKHSRTYNQDFESGSKRKLSWFTNYMKSLGHDTHRLWQRIDDVIIKTILSAWPVLKHSYHACFPSHDVIPACCELLGTDILLDRRLNPHILEVNHSPSFHTDTSLDIEVKEALITDMFSMMNLDHCDKRKIIREDRKRVRNRLLNVINKDSIGGSGDTISFQKFYRHEMAHRGGYRLVYPNAHSDHQYSKFFQQGQASVYSDTSASRARDLANTMMREELMQKAKEEAARRISPLQSRSKINIDSENGSVPRIIQKPTISKNSFEPQTIVEAEEKERLALLAHRDFLVKSYGMQEVIYMAMKKNNALRHEDEKKYSSVRSASTLERTKIPKSILNKASAPTIKNMVDFDEVDVPIRCGEVQLNVRRDLPSAWGGMNKSQIARTLNNALKITTANTREQRNMRNMHY